MTEYILLILYFSSFICLCALVCLYFSGCQEMTYKHDGKDSVGLEKLIGRKKQRKTENWFDLVLFSILWLITKCNFMILTLLIQNVVGYVENKAFLYHNI